MFVALWNYLKGYVIIEITGFGIERFLNLSSLKGVYLKSVSREKNCVKAQVMFSDMDTVNQCAEKTGCNVKIIDYIGMPFVAKRYKKRPALFMGFAAFIFIIYIMSLFVWNVNVEGNITVPTEDIIKVCEENGLKAGKLKRSIDTKQTSRILLESFDSLAWVGIKTKGTNIFISVEEVIPETEIVDKTQYSDILASKAGIIKKTVISDGTALVKEGDVVEKGDKLVSGIVESVSDDGTISRKYTKSNAQIYADVWYDFSVTENYIQEKQVYTGRTKTVHTLNLFNADLCFDFFGESFDEFKVEDENYTQLHIGDYNFPVKWGEYTQKEYVTQKTELSYDEVVNVIEEEILDITEQIMLSGDIIDIQKQYSQDGDSVTAKVTVQSYENIGVEQNGEYTDFQEGVTADGTD